MYVGVSILFTQAVYCGKVEVTSCVLILSCWCRMALVRVRLRGFGWDEGYPSKQDDRCV